MLILPAGGYPPALFAPAVMPGVVIGSALAPLMISAGGGAESPFFTNFFWRIGLAAGYMLYLFVWCPVNLEVESPSGIGPMALWWLERSVDGGGVGDGP